MPAKAANCEEKDETAKRKMKMKMKQHYLHNACSVSFDGCNGMPWFSSSRVNFFQPNLMHVVSKGSCGRAAPGSC